MVGTLADLPVHAVGRLSRDAQTASGENLLVFAIELVAVTVPLADLRGRVCPARKAALGEQARVSAQPHRTAEFIHAFQLTQFVNDAIRRRLIELGRVGVLQPAHIARKLNHHGLHAQTNSEIWNFALAPIADSGNHAFHAALAESARNQNTYQPLDARP